MPFGKNVGGAPEGKHVGGREGRGSKAKASLRGRDAMGKRGGMTKTGNSLRTKDNAKRLVKGKDKGRFSKG